MANPREGANPISVLLFWWTVGLFRKDDLPDPLKSDCSSHLGDRLQEQWQQQLSGGKKPSLLKAIALTFSGQYALLGLLSATHCLGLKLVQPMLMGWLLEHFRPGSGTHKDVAYTYAGGLVLLSLSSTLLFRHITLGALHVGMRVRVACTSLVYRKSLRLSRAALGRTDAGAAVNLLSNDVSRFDVVSLFLHSVWTAPLSSAIIAYILYQDAGCPGLIGVGVVLVVVALQVHMAKLTSAYRRETARKTDERVRLTGEIISCIQLIKMCAWEKPYAQMVSIARKTELDEITKISCVRGLFMAFQITTARLATFGTVLSFLLLGRSLSSDKAFVYQSYLTSLCFGMAVQFVRGVAEMAEAMVSITRLEEYLMLQEFQENEEQLAGSYGVVLQRVTAKWDIRGNALQQVDLRAKRGALVAIIGHVGSGKTSLLQAILGELPVSTGCIGIYGKISYSGQEPWLFASSIRQNILFGRPFDGARYSQVVRVCALEQDLERLPNGDQTLVDERGSSLSGGQKARVNLARAVYNDADIYLLDDPLSAVDIHVGRRLFDECIATYLANKTRLLVTHQLQHIRGADHVVVLNEGAVEVQGSFRELLGNDNADEPEAGQITKEPINSLLRQASLKRTGEVAPVNIEASSEGALHKSAYLEYFGSGGTVCAIAILFLLTQAAASATDWWMAHVTSLPTYHNSTELHIYAATVVVLLATTLSRSVAFCRICTHCSSQLHSSMLAGIMRTHLRFFSANSSGRIMNRFSKDLGSVDELLPKAILDASQIILMMTGNLILAVFVNQYLLIPIIGIGSIFWFIRKIYLKTSKNVKRLEGIAKSPIFTHLNATLEGLPTIRASGAQEALCAEFDRHQDLHSSAWYTFITTGQAFGLALDMACLVFVTLVIFSSLMFEDAFVGLAITQSMALVGMMQWGVRQSAEVANQMTSVERIVEYKNAPEEPLLEGKSPPKNWPHQGRIEFQNVFLRYGEHPPVIRNLSVVIQPKEKVGVVGRSGAGKSSLISALCRLAHVEGSVRIDDVDTATVDLHALRASISIIPQDPVLFSGTLRRNLDPFDLHPDHALRRVLDQVELRDSAALDSQVSQGNLSAGQRQLVCLARAMLRGNRIVVLDEATAHVDPHTDTKIQKTIRTEFARCTVVTVAHRLNTVIDCDKVLVMETGAMVEFDHPHVLLQNREGHFSRLVHDTGPVMAEQLARAAEVCYHDREVNNS